MKKIISLMFLTFLLPSHILAATPVDALAKVGVKVIASSKIQTDQDSWIQPEDQSTVTDEIDYWLQRLPKESDKHHNSYMVIPKLGVIAPINTASSSHPDYEKIKYGKTFEINNYLQSGVFKYPMTALPGHEGNGVYFGHSSYWKKDSGRYKTIFTTIPLLAKGDSIWVYTRGSDSGAFSKYVYEVNLSYDTSPSDIGVMMPTPGATITLVGCTDIGRADGRWIVKANLNSKLTKQIMSTSITTTMPTDSSEAGQNDITEQEEPDTEINSPDTLPGMETGDVQAQAVVEPTISVSQEDQGRLNLALERINKLSPEGKKRIINRLTKYFIHVRNNMPGALGLANYLSSKLDVL